jgi:hypothetical protein
VKEGLISIPRGKTNENLIFMLIFKTYTDSVVLSVFLLEKIEGAIQNEQSRDTGHKAQISRR